MNGILNLDFMHYTTVISLEMSDEPKIFTHAEYIEKSFSDNPYDLTAVYNCFLII